MALALGRLLASIGWVRGGPVSDGWRSACARTGRLVHAGKQHSMLGLTAFLQMPDTSGQIPVARCQCAAAQLRVRVAAYRGAMSKSPSPSTSRATKARFVWPALGLLCWLAALALYLLLNVGGDRQNILEASPLLSNLGSGPRQLQLYLGLGVLGGALLLAGRRLPSC